MADRFAGKISIGGNVPADKVTTLIDAINAEEVNLNPEWADKPFCPESKQDLIDALDKSGHIVLCDHEVRNGMFDCLEAELMKLGIAWERWSDHYCEYDAEIVWWQPGMDAPDGVICDSDGHSLCCMDSVLEAYRLLQGDFVRGAAYNRIEDAKAKLGSVVKEVPTLPPLKFVG